MNTSRSRLHALLAVASLVLPGCASAPQIATTEKSAREFAATCLRVFENLDMESFIECFAEDATVFFPAPESPMRYNGQGAIREQFQLVFSAIRGDSTAGPPYHRLSPELLHVKVLADNAAVVTFHLIDPSRVARRTMVLHRQNQRWFITHLHASNVASR
jgi:ketosteroid isomerase-like protein